MRDSSTSRSTVFISYSHTDAEYLKRLRVHLAPYEREHKVDVWDDTRITPGARWKEEIEQAMNAAKVAILLVSADFMASEFIAKDELPPLLEAAEQEGTLIVPVILSPCAFHRSKITRYQALNKPSEPLIRMPRWQQEEIWAKLAEQAADVLVPVLSVDPLPQLSLTQTIPQEEHKDPAPASKTEAAARQAVTPTSSDSSEMPTKAKVPSLGTTLLIYRNHHDYWCLIKSLLSAKQFD